MTSNVSKEWGADTASRGEGEVVWALKKLDLLKKNNQR